MRERTIGEKVDLINVKGRKTKEKREKEGKIKAKKSEKERY